MWWNLKSAVQIQATECFYHGPLRKDEFLSPWIKTSGNLFSPIDPLTAGLSAIDPNWTVD